MQRSLKLQIGQPPPADSTELFPLSPLVSAQPFARCLEKSAPHVLPGAIDIFGRHFASTDSIEDSNPTSHLAWRIEIALEGRQIETAFAVRAVVTGDAVITQKCFDRIRKGNRLGDGWF